MISLIELGRAEQALAFATTELAVAQQLTDLVVGGVHEPEVAALVLGKAAEAGERGVELRVAPDVELPAGLADPRDLVTIVGNLLDNAIDAAADARARAGCGSAPERGPGRGRDRAGGRRQRRRAGRGAFGPDLPARLLHQEQRSPLGRGIGLALVAQAAHRHGGAVRVRNETGAVFTVTLRRTADVARPAVASQPSSS